MIMRFSSQPGLRSVEVVERHSSAVSEVGDRFGSWTLRRFIDKGGNGQVWEVEGDDGQAAALKILSRFGGDAYPRFKREVEIVSGLDANRYAILPILEASIPARPTRSRPPWYVMPLATPMGESLKGATLVQKVGATRQIAGTLGALARLDPPVHHRDVKPANLFNHRGLFVIGDFGLARRPTDEDLSGDRAVGPWRHLPSEVFVGDVEPDPERVDVHCLALCLWQFATGRSDPPRGAISAGGQYDLTRYTDEDYAGQLSVIIAGATSENPQSRPTLAAFADQLGSWLEGWSARDELVRENERVRRLRNEVLRLIVAEVRRDASPTGLFWNATDPDSPSTVSTMTMGELSEGLDELIELGFAVADVQRAGRGAVISGIYPTLEGILEVESLEILLAQAAPLARTLQGQPRDVIDVSQFHDYVTIGDVSLAPAEASFQLRLLHDLGFVSYRPQYETGGRLLLDVRVTTKGREWLIDRQSRA
jgi:serine/threonine protein kinase